MEPTKQQQEIIKEDGCCVVIAQPGSGKTFTLARKIKNILERVPPYRGVIAISYTNKASDELRRRSLEGGSDKKGSFFGTIDKFYISEIVMPFGIHVFGNPIAEFNITKLDDTEKSLKDLRFENLQESHISLLKKHYQNGTIFLDTVGILSLYIIDNSLACRNYLKARYSHIIIDEYQDSGEEQHELFLRLQQLGLCAVAVGDVNQSIYAFSKKDSKYLLMLAKQTANFKTYSLSVNHRSHVSIINYSTRLLSSTYSPVECDDIRVFEKRLKGSEKDIGKWLNIAIPHYMKKYKVENFNKVGVLVRGKRTADLIDNEMEIPRKLFMSTPLDEDSSLWGGIFRKVLNLTFDSNSTKYAMLEEHLNLDMEIVKAKKLLRLLGHISKQAAEDYMNLKNSISTFVNIARLIFPHGENKNAINILKSVLDSKEMLDSFKPAEENEVQIMTLHKSKGLEFDIVFHLDLYRWILPMYKGDYVQDINLHYVGITRARKCCILCSSTIRHRQNDTVDADKSEFLSINGLPELRLNCEI